MVHSHAVHLALGALLTPSTMCVAQVTRQNTDSFVLTVRRTDLRRGWGQPLWAVYAVDGSFASVGHPALVAAERRQRNGTRLETFAPNPDAAIAQRELASLLHRYFEEEEGQLPPPRPQLARPGGSPASPAMTEPAVLPLLRHLGGEFSEVSSIWQHLLSTHPEPSRAVVVEVCVSTPHTVHSHTVCTFSDPHLPPFLWCTAGSAVHRVCGYRSASLTDPRRGMPLRWACVSWQSSRTGIGSSRRTARCCGRGRARVQTWSSYTPPPRRPMAEHSSTLPERRPEALWCWATAAAGDSATAEAHAAAAAVALVLAHAVAAAVAFPFVLAHVAAAIPP